MLENYEASPFSFVPIDLNEIKLERNIRKATVSFGMLHGNSSELISRLLADLRRF